MTDLHVVVIARNEGERLKQCINSIVLEAGQIVYVDSGSTDGSQEFAQQKGLQVVDLSLGKGFSAGRARNAGYNAIPVEHSNKFFVQFVDGDCELDVEWLNHASGYLDRHADVAIVCGRRREKYPEQTVYNSLCDIEWDTPVGTARSCGGDFMIRSTVMGRVNGFNPDVIAGEEPELCFRVRECGFEVHRLDHEMTRHDADIKRFGQWWKRSMRSGYAYSHNFYLHGRSHEKLNQRTLLSILFWGIAIPLAALCLLIIQNWFTLVLVLFLYSLFWIKVSVAVKLAKKLSTRSALLYGFFTLTGKVAQAFGAIKFFITTFFRGRGQIIEYK